MTQAPPCPVCRFPLPDAPCQVRAEVTLVRCPRCGDFKLSDTAFRTLQPRVLQQPSRADMQLSAWLRNNAEHGVKLPVLDTRHVAPGEFSISTLSVAERRLELSDAIGRKTSHPGAKVKLEAERDCVLAWAENGRELFFYLDALAARDLVEITSETKRVGARVDPEVVVLPSGWDVIDDRRRSAPRSTQAFVAMWFDDAVRPVYDYGIERAIEGAGFDAYRVDEDLEGIRSTRGSWSRSSGPDLSSLTPRQHDRASCSKPATALAWADLLYGRRAGATSRNTGCRSTRASCRTWYGNRPTSTRSTTSASGCRP